ncbi:F-box protein CPR1-like [Rutidosis leptorrhynchoides]|uniref:F-box protein CPR1-like n=1 Tax=Rutidosis leptorrhynchoides TaxID=125765 RepID=UPI003A9A1F22
MSDSHNTMCDLNRLPPDLVEEILPFLPAKSLGRFKSISKRWYSLISSPEFIKTHIQKFTGNNPNPNPTHLILLLQYGEFLLYSLDIKQLNTQTTTETLTAKRLKLKEPCYQIQGSCNGLILLHDIYHNLYIVNPTTKKTLQVPYGKSNDGIYGFGYDFSTDDYKIISISYTEIPASNAICTFVRVYSLRNSSWHMLPNPPYQLHDYYNLHPGVLLNNNLHWVVRSSRLTLTIATFRLADEQYHEIEFPDSVNYDTTNFSQLYAFSGKLVVVLSVWYAPNFVYELWVMEEYGVPKSWKKLCIFDNDIHLDFPFFAQVCDLDILLGSDANEIFVYNMDERRRTSVTTEGCPKGFMVCGMLLLDE